MLVKIDTGDLFGVDAYRVVVEVDATRGGMPGCNLVGLPSARVTEGKVRVRAALVNSGFKLGARRVTVNLAPAEMRKDTAAFDLPIALGILGAYELIPKAALAGVMAVGELALDGGLRPVKGVLPVAILARQLGIKSLIVPRDCLDEARVVEGLDVRPAAHLQQVVAFLLGEISLRPPPVANDNGVRDSQPAEMDPAHAGNGVDMGDVRGQAVPKRALEIAAAGGHNLLMVGPPGSGKSMLARRLPTILPAMSFDEALETTKIYSVAGLLGGASLVRQRPFRAPHHTVSRIGLVGGSAMLRPGELSLAHHGVLFLDELLEFQRTTLEGLRQPLEDRSITITRAHGTVTFPADVQLVAAMNPCPCGHRGDPRRTCTCSNVFVERYWSRLSGPLLDRIDLLVEVPAISFAQMTTHAREEPSAAVAARVTAARERQLARAENGGGCNARLGAAQVRAQHPKGPDIRRLLEIAVERMGMSARAIQRVLRVARTIADLSGEAQIETPHVAEALAYRQLERPGG